MDSRPLIIFAAALRQWYFNMDEKQWLGRQIHVRSEICNISKSEIRSHIKVEAFATKKWKFSKVPIIASPPIISGLLRYEAKIDKFPRATHVTSFHIVYYIPCFIYLQSRATRRYRCDELDASLQELQAAGLLLNLSRRLRGV